MAKTIDQRTLHFRCRNISTSCVRLNNKTMFYLYSEREIDVTVDSTSCDIIIE